VGQLYLLAMEVRFTNRVSGKFARITNCSCLLIDVAITSDWNIIRKETGKKIKCKNLSVKVQLM
jgi:hypothetical protein